MNTPFLIGEFKVDPQLNLIVSADTETVVVPKVMSLLLCLAEASPEPVSQETLFAKVWPDQVVSDSSLYQAIAQLRKALGDTEKTKRYVERVSSKGYRLIKPVRLIESLELTEHDANPQVNPIAESSDKKSPDNDKSFDSMRVYLKALVASLFLLLLPLTLYWFNHSGDSQNLGREGSLTKNSSLDKTTQSKALNEINSIALIRFQSESLEPLARETLLALDDILLTQLGATQKLKVVSVSQVEPWLNVDAYLTGKIVEENNQFRIFLRIESANNREVIWAKVFSGEIGQLFELQDQITQSLFLQLNKTRSDQNFLNQQVSPQSFEKYLLARHFWEKRKANELEQARDILEQMRDQQELFPLAAVALCETYHFLFIYSDWSLSEVNKQCGPLLDLALEKSPGLGQAIAAKGLLIASEGNIQAARELMAKAVDLAPNYALGYLWYANLLRDLGEYPRALTMSQKAFELAPMSPVINRSLAYSHLNLRQVEKANYYYQRAITLEPDYIHRPIGDLDFFPLTKERAKAFLSWAKSNPKAFQRDSVYRLNQAQVWIALGEIEKAAAVVEAFTRNGLSPAFTQYVKATLEIAQEKFEQASETFNQRRELAGEKSRLDMPYIQSLMMIGEYHQAYRLALRWFPEFESNQVEVTQQNIYRAIFFAQIKRAVSRGDEWLKLANNVDRFLSQHTLAPSIQLAEWLAFREQKQAAATMAEELMLSGWLPDTNSEPYAYFRMRSLFPNTQLGAERFETLLAKNIRFVLPK